MSPEEKIEAAQKLIDEARAELTAKKRSWPEKIEAGMCFGEEDGDKSMWIVCDDLQLVCVSSYKAGIRWGGWRETKTRLRYLGRDLITIRTNAHEPTGAGLVGVTTEYELGPDDVIEASDDICRHGFSERRSHNWRDSFPHGITVKDAREQCKGMIHFFRKAVR